MAVRVNEVNQVTQVPDAQKTQAGDGSFKFTLASAITDADLQAKVDALMQDITAQGNRIAEHMDQRLALAGRPDGQIRLAGVRTAAHPAPAPEISVAL